MSTPSPTWSREPVPPNPFNCELAENLPFGGAEVLFMGFIFLFASCSFVVVFLDVGVKQMWPEKFLDPAVAARIAQIQNGFPLLKKKGDEEEDEEEEKKDKKESDVGTPFYTKCASQEPYIAGRSVDEDIITMLCNNSAFPTVSDYCSCTVRGYTMAQTMLACASFILGFMWIHNVMLSPSNGGLSGIISVLGYILIILTGIVTWAPNEDAVYRHVDICMFSNIVARYKKGGLNPMLNLHMVGVSSFIYAPLACHLYDVVKVGKTLPNYAGTVIGLGVQLACAAVYILGPVLQKKGTITPVMAKKWGILAEILTVFACFMAYFQHEFYAAALCSGYLPHLYTMMFIAAFAPFVKFIKTHYSNAPTSFPTDASIMLIAGNTPVAQSGPVAALQFSQCTADLPVVNPIKSGEQSA